jgi:hypothetical protein
MTDHERILLKIKKLLTFAQDGRGNKEEMDVAMNMALKMMAKHNLEMAEVISADIETNTEAVVADLIDQPNYDRKIPNWYNWLGTTVSNTLDCKARIRPLHKDGITKIVYAIYGYKDDVEVAKWLFGYLLAQIDALTTQAWKRYLLDLELDYGYTPEVNASKRRGWKDNYRRGLVVGISQRIKDTFGKEEKQPIISHGKSLVVIKEDKIIEKYGKFDNQHKARNTASNDTYYQGIIDSKQINVNRVVKGSTQEARQLQ